MIKRVRIQNYKALRDVSLELTSIHVLIGPNDSGKTSILEAIAALCRSVDHPLATAFTGSWEGRELVWMGKRDSRISLTASVKEHDVGFEYLLSCYCTSQGRTMKVEAEQIQFDSDSHPAKLDSKGDVCTKVYRVALEGQNAAPNLQELATTVYESFLRVDSYHWDGRFLALPVAADTKRKFRMDASGFGLALVLDDILGFDRDRFVRLEQRFKKIFPAIKSIKLIAENAFKSPVDDPELVPMLKKSDGKGLYFEFDAGGEPIPARQVSDGVLLILAYLAVLHLPEPPRVLLVEEPENGIHPKRLKDVLSILRELVGEQSKTQVVLTTHSPYVVDLFKPEEVTLCSKEEDGSIRVRRLSESKTVQEQLDVFTLGEIWTAEDENLLAQPVASQGD